MDVAKPLPAHTGSSIYVERAKERHSAAQAYSLNSKVLIAHASPLATMSKVGQMKGRLAAC